MNYLGRLNFRGIFDQFYIIGVPVSFFDPNFPVFYILD